jgi:aryl-alcohol dehydrogenase-like predicted oxidoreductase
LRSSLDALALAAVLAQPWADVVLSGASTAEQVRSNVQALTVPWDAQAETSLLPVAEEAQAYWQTRSALAWN